MIDTTDSDKRVSLAIIEDLKMTLIWTAKFTDVRNKLECLSLQAFPVSKFVQNLPLWSTYKKLPFTTNNLA